MTVAGLHTVAELRDWVGALDAQIATMGDTSVRLAPTWSARDGAGFQAWIADFKALQARYAPARATAQGKLDAWSLLPESVDGAEEEWQGVERALRPSGTGSARGEFQELGNRLQAASSAPVVYTYDQPRPGTDFDLGAYQAADTAAKAIDAITPPPMTLGQKILLAGGALLGLVVVGKAARL